MAWRTHGAEGYPAGLPVNPMADPKIRAWDHLGIAVRSIEAAVPLFREVLGGQFMLGGDDYAIGIRTAMFKFPSTLKIELMEPLSAESYLHRFIERHGEGFHHTTLFVENVEATIADLEATGFEVVDTDLSDSHWRETYVHPRSGFGCLIQIVDTDLGWLEPHPYCTIEDVVAEKWRWWGAQIWHIDRLPEGYSE